MVVNFFYYLVTVRHTAKVVKLSGWARKIDIYHIYHGYIQSNPYWAGIFTIFTKFRKSRYTPPYIIINIHNNIIFIIIRYLVKVDNILTGIGFDIVNMLQIW